MRLSTKSMKPNNLLKWTALLIRFRKKNAMKCRKKTVKHQLEAKKYTITEETMTNSEVQVILIDNEADLLKVQTDPT